jgi:hypothetical protein
MDGLALSAPRTVLLTGMGAGLAHESLSGLLPGTVLLTDAPRSGRSTALLQCVKESDILNSREDKRTSAPLYIRKSV